VVATDGHPDAFSYLWPRVPEAWKLRLTAVEVDSAEMEIPPCDLVNASFALPFCEPTHFPALRPRASALSLRYRSDSPPFHRWCRSRANLGDRPSDGGVHCTRYD
jgi:hypothetical protein